MGTEVEGLPLSEVYRKMPAVGISVVQRDVPFHYAGGHDDVLYDDLVPGHVVQLPRIFFSHI